MMALTLIMGILRVANKPKEYMYLVIDEAPGGNWAQGKFF